VVVYGGVAGVLSGLLVRCVGCIAWSPCVVRVSVENIINLPEILDRLVQEGVWQEMHDACLKLAPFLSSWQKSHETWIEMWYHRINQAQTSTRKTVAHDYPLGQ
jgi:hypothetical protein